MRKHLIVGFCAVCCFSIGLLVAKNISGMSVLNMNNIESLAECEVYDNQGNVLGGCRGNGSICWFDNVSCYGTPFSN